jgi:DNA (cytosine-5)-methyltransferase 1
MSSGQANAEVRSDGGAPSLTCLHEAPVVVTHSLRGEGFDASEDGTGRGTPLVPVAFAQNSRDEVRLMNGDGSIVGALAAEPGMKQTCYIAQQAVAIGLDEEQNAMVDAFGTLKARTHGGGFEGSVMTPAMQVRRLTPRECERLQGFPDDYTKIADKTPDGPRYKALGNSWAVPVVRWVGERINRALA